MRTLWEARKKIIAIGGLLLLIMLMINMNNRLSEYFHLSGERDKLSTEVSYLRATRMALETQVAYANSDKAVEDWARNEAHLARPGDKVIIPIAPEDQTPTPVVKVTPTPTSIENWEIWWALFFEH